MYLGKSTLVLIKAPPGHNNVLIWVLSFLSFVFSRPLAERERERVGALCARNVSITRSFLSLPAALYTNHQTAIITLDKRGRSIISPSVAV